MLGWPLGMLPGGFDLHHWAQEGDSAELLVGALVASLLISWAMNAWSADLVREIDAERRAGRPAPG